MITFFSSFAYFAVAAAVHQRSTLINFQQQQTSQASYYVHSHSLV